MALTAMHTRVGHVEFHTARTVMVEEIARYVIVRLLLNQDVPMGTSVLGVGSPRQVTVARCSYDR